MMDVNFQNWTEHEGCCSGMLGMRRRGGACVGFGGSAGDSRQRGSETAGYWIRLQPESSTMCRSVRRPAHICSRGPSCLQDRNQDKNTPREITEGRRGAAGRRDEKHQEPRL